MATVDLVERRAQLTEARQKLIDQVNWIAGQLALIDEMEKPAEAQPSEAAPAAPNRAERRRRARLTVEQPLVADNGIPEER